MRSRRVLLIGVALVLSGVLAAGCFLRGQKDDEQQLVGDIPYVDGATYSYDIQDQEGTSIGDGSFGTTKDELDGTAVWIISTATNVPGSVEEESKVYTDAETLSPIRYETTMTVSKGTYEITAVYGEDEVQIDAETPDGPQSLTRPKPDNAYDNDQLLMLGRALPLEEDYSAEFNLVIPKSANKTPTSVKVVGRETVTVPAGEFDCWKVQYGFGGVSQSAWYAVEGSKPMVKYDNGTTVYLLTDIQE